MGLEGVNKLCPHARSLLFVLITSILLLQIGDSRAQGDGVEQSTEDLKREWMSRVIDYREFDRPAQFSKFSDDWYYTTQTFRWTGRVNSKLVEVVVPKGFVTDLASIPRVFWIVIPRDGVYAQAAVVHDYMYWKQVHGKDLSDGVFDQAMKDLEVGLVTRSVIISAVKSVFGDLAWRANERYKMAGERRVLRAFPSDPKVSWSKWKEHGDNLQVND